MRVSISGLKTFKKLYAARFREDLNEADALRKAQALLNLWEAIQGNPLGEKVDSEGTKLLINKKQYECTK